MSIVGPRPQMEVDFRAYPQHVQDVIYNVKPGITGIGSIAFRDEEDIISRSSLSPHDCYAQLIAPYKGELELWYQEHRSLWVDAAMVLLTPLAIVSPHSDLVWRLFTSLPPRPACLVGVPGAGPDVVPLAEAQPGAIPSGVD